jgi:hypothetical protein
MARERHRALMQHFDELCDLPAEQRESRLAELRSHDPDLASHVASLLAQDAESFVLGGVVQRLAAEVAQDHAGRVLSGRYELLRSLGGGGGGSVWEALDRIREERVAIKLLGRELGTDPAAVRRFEREFRAVARLDHPNILRVHALGRDGDDRFIVMAFAPGGDLRRLARAPLDELLPLFLQLALALDYVHGRRIVHRDLKPANVVLSGDEPPVPLLADFGIARVEDEDSAVLTRTDAVVGTIDYLSPEQVRGGRVDPRSDLYALGCLIFWLVSGRAPFEGGTLERMSARLHRPAPSLRSVAPTAPPELAALVARLLEADPQRRPQSAVEVAHELAGLFAGDGRDAALCALLRSTQRGAFLYDPGLVGRDADLDALRTWLAAPRTAADAQGAEVLALIGDGGIGKTYLLGRLLDGLRTAGWPTWEIGFRRSATGAPGPFVALEDALSLLGADSLRAEAVRLRPIASGQDSASRDRRAQRLAEAMALATDAAPNRTGGRAVLVIDDLHQADPGAIDLLSALLRALGRDPARAPAVIVSLRPAGRDRIDALRTAGCPVREHALDPIDAPAIETIAARMLASSPSALPPALIAQLSRESQGHPLLVRADLRALIDDGWLRRVPGGWEYPPPSARATSCPPRSSSAACACCRNAPSRCCAAPPRSAPASRLRSWAAPCDSPRTSSSRPSTPPSTTRSSPAMGTTRKAASASASPTTATSRPSSENSTPSPSPSSTTPSAARCWPSAAPPSSAWPTTWRAAPTPPALIPTSWPRARPRGASTTRPTPCVGSKRRLPGSTRSRPSGTPRSERAPARPSPTSS